MTDFREKANFFNFCFAKQCTPIENDSFIPTETNCLCDATILAVCFDGGGILKIITALDINRVHRHDNIFTCLIKIYDSSIAKPFSMIFRNFLNFGIFPGNWERSNIVPFHKKGSKQLMQYYSLVSLMTIRSKIFERFNWLYNFVEANSLFCSNQYGFRKAADSR